MEYKVGTYIPDSEILRQYTDEDGEIFLELRGMEDTLFRVNKENQVCYQIDKSLLVNEELTLVKDFSHFKPESTSELEFQPWQESQLQEPEKDIQKSYVPDKTAPDGGRAESLRILDSLEEGQQVPENLKPLCKRSIYGGYSLRYDGYLYILGSDYCVLDKTQESLLSYPLEDDSDLLDPEEMGIPVILEDNHKNRSEEIELQKGDILPSHLRSQCEQYISAEGGSRIMIGDYLYLLDAQYKVTSKMKLSYTEDEEPEVPLTFPDTAELEKKMLAKKQKQLSVEEIAANMVKTFEIALEKYNISADFFKETVLNPDNREVLIRAYHGDLTRLNDDTREASAQGKMTVLEEKGISLFKAVLVHELYIKSTRSGRGENMKYFLTHIIAAEPDGTQRELKGDMSLAEQKEALAFFGSRARIYTDKTEIIRRVRRQIRANIFEEYKELQKGSQKVRFNAYIIMKLYRHTNRLDRGDGITMIRLVRDMMDYNNSKMGHVLR
jgi:hypothetical protein